MAFNRPAIKGSDFLSIAWLDTHVYSEDNLVTQKDLRSISSELYPFSSRESFECFIQSLSEHDRLFLIISGGLGAELVPKIHDHFPLVSVIVFCMDRKRNEAWSKNFPKVGLDSTSSIENK